MKIPLKNVLNNLNTNKIKVIKTKPGKFKNNRRMGSFDYFDRWDEN